MPHRFQNWRALSMPAAVDAPTTASVPAEELRGPVRSVGGPRRVDVYSTTGTTRLRRPPAELQFDLFAPEVDPQFDPFTPEPDPQFDPFTPELDPFDEADPLVDEFFGNGQQPPAAPRAAGPPVAVIGAGLLAVGALAWYFLR